MAVDFDSLVLGPCMGVFGEGGPVLYTPPGGGAAVPLVAVFDDVHHQVVFDGDGAPVSANRAALGVQLSQFSPGAGPVQDGRVTLRGQSFIVDDVEPDGIGHAILRLRLTS